MNYVIKEKTQPFQNNLIISHYEYFCHHCSQKILGQQQLACSNPFCSNNYCAPCLINFYHNTPLNIKNIQNNPFSNFWKCPKCEGKCICDKCKSKFSLTSTDTEEHNKNNHFLGKKISSDAELIMWLSTGEDTSIDVQNVKFPFVPLNSKIKSKVFDKLIKIAKQCELFFRHKCKNEYIKKNCANCYETNFHQNDLLRFFNYETFLYYMKYLFLISNKIVCYSKENFNKNKNDFEELFKQFKEKKEVWIFKDTKIICKQCMYFLINKSNFFEKIKGIFLRKENKFLFYNNNELNEFEQKSLISKEKINNYNSNSKRNKDVDDIIITKDVFKIVKTPRNNIINENINKIENNDNNKTNDNKNNIVINYNNHNNNIYNTLILKDEYKFNDYSIFGINSYRNLPQIPIINNLYMNYNINHLSYLSSVNSNYYQLFFLELKQKITEVLKVVNLSKNEKDKSKYLSIVDLLNKKIINNINLIENSVISNINFLNTIIIQNGLNIEFIEIKQKIIEFIIENQKFLNQLNYLKFNYLNIEKIYIRTLFQ